MESKDYVLVDKSCLPSVQFQRKMCRGKIGGTKGQVMLLGQKIGIMMIVIAVVLALACKGLDILKTATISDNAKTGWIVMSLYLGCGAFGIIAKWLDEK